MFVQIGKMAVNMNRVDHIFFRENGEIVINFLTAGTGCDLAGDEAKAFLSWWENHADVYVCSVPIALDNDLPS